MAKSRLSAYRGKRHFDHTPEPSGEGLAPADGRQFVVQKHAARRLHYDFRLELDGVLKSWAVPKGPSLDPSVKSLAVEVEDHPVEYGTFEGVIPAGEYGGGTVLLWDRGTWEPQGDPRRGYRQGKLKFRLHGAKLRGGWTLVRMRSEGQRGNGKQNWLLMKSADEHARTGPFNILEALPDSVASARSLEQIAAAADRVWGSKSEARGNGHPGDGQPGQPASAPRRTPDRFTAPAGARRASLPRTFHPQLATLARQAPAGDDWLHELKFDGYRILCRLDKGRPRLLSRRGNDWTARFPTVAAAAADLPVKEAMLDGEVVVLNRKGASDFQALQNLMRHGRAADVVYYVFDLPFCGGHDLTASRLEDRKQLLSGLLQDQPGRGVVRFSEHIQGQGDKVFALACRRGLEGIISKRAGSTYQQRRSRDWLKIKCLKRQEFVVGGWTDPAGSREGLGALLLGYYDQGRLMYCGRVGTGFTSTSLRDLGEDLARLASDKPPFVNPPRGRDARDCHWVEPRLVAEVEFNSWTDDNVLRQASFRGLRMDKSPKQVTREEPAAVRFARGRSATTPAPHAGQAKRKAGGASGRSPRSAPGEVAGVRLTHPDRILYPQQGITKKGLADYYVSIAEWILPHVVNRPLTLVRCPEGSTGKCFYQKHLTDSMPGNLRGVEIQEKDETGVYVVIDDLAGLVALVQIGVLEVHPWGARADALEQPDRLVFDLDPGEGTPWSAVIKAARDLRHALDAHGLQTFLRTSGGKGLHIVAPLTGNTEWADLKVFAKRIADQLTAQYPDRYIATASKARRRGKIYIDYLRNQRGATAVASYSPRARPTAPVAAPLRWDELNARLQPDRYNVRNLPVRLTRLAGDPWEGFFQLKQQLPRAKSPRSI